MKDRKMNLRTLIIAVMLCGTLAPDRLAVFCQNPAKLSDKIEYMEFRNADIKDVLRQLSKQYGLNIIFSESVKGPITVQLKDISIDEALDVIITINGFVYSRKGEVIKVTTPLEAEKEGKRTQVFRLNNSSAESIKPSLDKVLSKEGSIAVESRSNSLVVTDIPSVISEIDRMLRQLDSTIPQVLIEARFIETSLGTAESLGIAWGTGVSINGAKRPVTFPYDRWDKPRGMYPEQTRTEERNETTGRLENITSEFWPKSTGGGDGYTLSAFPTVGGGDFTFGTLDASQLGAALNFIRSDAKSHLVSSPRIVTIDNQEAMIQVGETRRVLEQKQEQASTGVLTSSYNTIDVGVILRVTPHVTPDGHIKLNLKPEVSSVTGYEPSSGLLIIGQRKAQTEVIVKDGYTIAIGGLISSQRSESNTKVPFLGDLPLIGNLFKAHRLDPNSKTQLLIFVTARIIRDDEASPQGIRNNLLMVPEISPKNKLRNVFLTKKEQE